MKPGECRNPACGKTFVKWSSTQVACSYQCGLIVAADKAKRKKLKEIRKERRDWYVKNMTLNAAYVIAQTAVNLFVRLRDRASGCISCEKGGVEDAGHLFPIGAKYRCNPIRIDPRVIHGQCVECNHHLGGNVHGYLAGLKARYGQEYVDLCYDIKRMADHGELVKLSKDQVLEKAVEYRKLAREMKAAA